MLKSVVLEKLHEIIDIRIGNSKKAMLAAEESRNNETKSSAGDKYETGRAMMDIEKQKNEVQLNLALALKQELSQLKVDQKSEHVVPGSLVFTDSKIFFISIGLGKIELTEGLCYAISTLSPIGSLLLSKKVGSKISFQGAAYEIIEIK